MRHRKSARALRLAPVVVVVCSLLAGGVRGAFAAGNKFEPPGGGFSVSFPAAPEHRTYKQQLDNFVLTVNAYGVEHEGMTYFVTWVGDLPAAAISDPRKVDMFYAGLEYELISTGKAAGKGEVSVASRSDISLGGVSGRQMVFNTPVAMGVLRSYKVGRGFFTISVFGNKSGYSAQHAVAFLDSFKLTGKKEQSSRQ
jgi:hypothetical protein